MADLEQEIKELIVEALMLEDVTPDEIDANEALFIEGLGLDSIDALELAIAIEKNYGLKINASDDEKRAIFESVHSLAAYIGKNKE
jgi:acyl carrier protein